MALIVESEIHRQVSFERFELSLSSKRFRFCLILLRIHRWKFDLQTFFSSSGCFCIKDFVVGLYIKMFQNYVLS